MQLFVYFLVFFFGQYTGQAVLTGTLSWELELFVGAKFYCLHALTDGS